MRVKNILICFILTFSLAAGFATGESAHFLTVDSACRYIITQAKARAKDVYLSFPTGEIVGKYKYDDLCEYFTDVAAVVSYADYECFYDDERFNIKLSFTYRPGVKIADAVKSGDISRLTEEEHRVLYIARAALDEIKTRSNSQIETERGIHDYIMRSVEYRDRSLSYDAVSPELSATNALINGYANCQGYADAFYMMCELAGIEAGMQYGKQRNGDNHIWNTVKLDGKWFIVDATWDDTSLMSDERLCYRAFNMGLDMCGDNLVWQAECETAAISESSDGYYFYMCPSLAGFGSTYTDFRALAESAYSAYTENGERIIHLMFKGEYLTPDYIVSELNRFLDENGADVKWTLDSWYMTNNTILALQWRE